MEKETLNKKIEEGNEEKETLDKEIEILEENNEQKREESTYLLEMQMNLMKKIDKWGKQKGKLGKLIKDSKGIVVKSKKLIKKIRKMIPVNKKYNLHMSQTMENFYQSQKDNQELSNPRVDSERTISDHQNESIMKKKKKITRSQLNKISKDASDEEWEGEKMYHSTRPDAENDMDQEDYIPKRNKTMINTSIRRFKKNRQKNIQDSKYFQNNFSDSGNG